MKKFFHVVFLTVLAVVLVSGLAFGSDLSFKVISAKMTDEVATDISPVNSMGIELELQVINNGPEVKVWPGDFGIGFNDGTQDIRIPGFFITNAVSDPEDEMSFRYFQGTSIRKGTRYIKVFFSDMMNWQLMFSLQEGNVEEGILYFMTPVSETFPVTPLPESEGDEEGDLGW